MSIEWGRIADETTSSPTPDYKPLAPNQKPLFHLCHKLNLRQRACAEEGCPTLLCYERGYSASDRSRRVRPLGGRRWPWQRRPHGRGCTRPGATAQRPQEFDHGAGLPTDYDKKKILKALKKDFCCNGTVVDDPELGQVIQLQGDQRKNVSTFLVKVSLLWGQVGLGEVESWGEWFQWNCRRFWWEITTPHLGPPRPGAVFSLSFSFFVHRSRCLGSKGNSLFPALLSSQSVSALHLSTWNDLSVLVLWSLLDSAMNGSVLYECSPLFQHLFASSLSFCARATFWWLLRLPADLQEKLVKKDHIKIHGFWSQSTAATSEEVYWLRTRWQCARSSRGCVSCCIGDSVFSAGFPIVMLGTACDCGILL